MQTQTNTQTITAFFDSRTHAESAVEALTDAGIPSDSVRMIKGNDPTIASDAVATEDKGFFEKIGDFFMPDEDRQSYAEGLRRGGYLVSVQAEPAHTQRVIDILDTDGSVDMDERSESWRAEGWSGAADGASTSVPAKPATMGAEGDGTIEVVEEQMRVGKRDISHGSVRVRAYTVENQVSEDVTLQSANVEIVRRPVDRAVDAGDAAFADKTIEVEETAEEAVVSKDARVTEEIDIEKTVENATETVSGTVRHTEVEIEDDRKSKLSSVK